MAIEASFTVKQADFPLSGIFEDLSDVTIELDRIVPTNGAVIPYFWIYSEDENEFPRNVEQDVGIDTLKIIDEVDGQVFVRIDWNLDHESILTAIVNTDVTLLSGLGTSEQWTFEIRVSEQQQLSDFQAYCRDRDIRIELTQLHALSSLRSDREYDLTEGQRKALVLAYSRDTSTRHAMPRRTILRRSLESRDRRSRPVYSGVFGGSLRVL